MQLLAGANPDALARLAWRERLGEHLDRARGDARDEHLAAEPLLQREEHEVDRAVHADPEARHRRVGDRQLAGLALLEEERHHAAVAADDVAVAHEIEARLAPARVRVRRDEELLHAELGRAVEVDGGRRLVGRERDHARDAPLEGRVDDVRRAVHVRADRLDRVVLGDVHVLHRGGVHDDVDAVEGAHQALAIAHIADEVAHARVAQLLLHHDVLLLVAREDDHLRGLVRREQPPRERLAERASAARDQDDLAVEVGRGVEERLHGVGHRGAFCHGPRALASEGPSRGSGAPSPPCYLLPP